MNQDILNKISQAYNFSELTYVGSPEEEISSLNAFVKTKEGVDLFIKNYKKGHAEKRDISEIVEHFISQDNSIPVVLPYKNKDGKCHVIIEDEMYSVFPHIINKHNHPGSDAERTILTKSLGTMLGKIHAVSRKFPIPKTITPISWVNKSTVESIDELKKIKEVIILKDIFEDYNQRALSLVELKISLLKESNFHVKENEPMVVCHGDYHKANILFDNNKNIIGVCDWDLGGIGNPYSEFVRSFNMCVIRRDFDNLPSKKDFTKSFVDGYVNACGFEFDQAELSYAIESWYQKTISTTWPLSDHYYRSDTRADSLLDSELNKILFLRDNRQSIFEHIKSCLKNSILS